MFRSVITATGCFIPGTVIKNSDFDTSTFYLTDGLPSDLPVKEIIQKFGKITGIMERRYAAPGVTASEMAAKASELAIASGGIERESIDQLIVAHNFGDIPYNGCPTDIVPSLASRVKKKLGILNPSCIAYDLIFGCAGWLQGLIQADAFFKAGIAKKALIIGAETLSRVVDEHDRDGMIFADGAGACILEFKEVGDLDIGMLSANVRSDCAEGTDFIRQGNGYRSSTGPTRQFIKMNGRKVYEYALQHVAPAMKECFDASGNDIRSLKAILIHQANEKMDEAIVKAFYKLYGIAEPPSDVMPMCIHWLGNSSVATIPTLLDLVRRGDIFNHSFSRGDILLFASVGAGMNINAVCYGYE